MYRITYSITDSKGIEYSGEFQTIHNKPREITRKVFARHPDISLPFESYDVQVNKVIKKK